MSEPSDRPAVGQAVVQLIRPNLDALPSYRSALERGWSPDTLSDAAIGRELSAIADDPAGFIDLMEDLKAAGGPIILPDGAQVARLPGFRRWLWDGEFAGSFSFRFRPGSETLPPHCLGHIGYAVPEWKRGRGYAARGLELMLPELGRHGLRYVLIATRPDNLASQKVVIANGGYLVERYVPAEYELGEIMRWRIDLQETQ